MAEYHFLVSRGRAIGIVAGLLLIGSCRRHHVARTTAAAPRQQAPPKRQSPLPAGYQETGVASWYGVPYHGRPAADGEIYDMETLVAAHRLMPFNTWLQVTNLSNGKSVEVRVIDRGPFVGGRILDLSRAAARRIDMLGPGTAKVQITVIRAPVDVPSNDFYAVQVGAFAVRANAEQARARFAAKYGAVQLEVKQGKVPLWRVLVGKEASLTSAQQLANVLGAEDVTVFVVRLDETLVAPAENLPPSVATDTPQP